MRHQEIDWLFSSQGGMARKNPDLWKSFAEAVNSPECGPRDALYAYYNCLLGQNPAHRLAAAKSWMKWEFHAFASSSQADKDEFDTKLSAPIAVYKNLTWQWQDGSGSEVPIEVLKEMGLDENSCEDAVQGFRQHLLTTASTEVEHKSPMHMRPVQPHNPKLSEEELSPDDESKFVPAQNMLTCFYSVNNQYAMNNINLLDPGRMENAKHIPCIAVHGALDNICPIDTALELCAHWPQMELYIPVQSGHSMYDVAITNQLIQATDRLATMLNS